MYKQFIWIITLLIISTTCHPQVDIDSLKKLASNGDIKTQLRLGELYTKGEDIPQDYTLAAIWYRRAAEAGDAEAQYQLAEMYSNGNGVPVDWEMSKKWYKVSADQGNPEAQYTYAFFYYHYDHESILNWFGDYYRNYNHKKAIAWFEKSANQGHLSALYFLGAMHENGDGVDVREPLKTHHSQQSER